MGSCLGKKEGNDKKEIPKEAETTSLIHEKNE